jgi:hypothetical protein
MQWFDELPYIPVKSQNILLGQNDFEIQAIFFLTGHVLTFESSLMLLATLLY